MDECGSHSESDRQYLASVRAAYTASARRWAVNGTVWKRFDKLLACLGIDMEQVAFTNLAKCFCAVGQNDTRFVKACLAAISFGRIGAGYSAEGGLHREKRAGDESFRGRRRSQNRCARLSIQQPHWDGALTLVFRESAPGQLSFSLPQQSMKMPRQVFFMARRLPFAFWGAVVLLAASCATPYQQHSLRGGYDDSRIDSNTVLVSFKGNGYTPKDRVQTYMLYRCAEVTANAGYDYFVIVSSDDEVKEGAINLPSSYSSTTTASVYGFGNSAVGSAYTQGTYYPSQSIPYHKHACAGAHQNVQRG